MAKVIKNCLHCGNEFMTGWYVDRSKYCNRKCLSLHKAKVNKIKTREINKSKTQEKRVIKQRRQRIVTIQKTITKNAKTPFIKVGDGTVKFGDNMLTLKNYKEPLTEIPKDQGFGWFGTLAAEMETGKVQCHICGQLFESLPGHITMAHKMKARDYREKFGLAYSTALISEKQRMKLKMNTLAWLKTLTPEEKKAQFERAKLLSSQWDRSKRVQPKKTLEGMNKDASCPDQTLQVIKDAAKDIGHVPSKREFMEFKGNQRYVHLAYKHFGSWSKAIEMCGFDKPQRPTTYKRKEYTDEELLEYLRIYAQEYQAIPTFSDWKRDLLPSYDIYLRHFGTIENARQLAGVYQIIAPDRKFMSRSKHFRDVYKQMGGNNAI